MPSDFSQMFGPTGVDGNANLPTGSFNQIYSPTTSNTAAPVTGVRGKAAAAKAASQSLVFPSDLKTGTGNYPYMIIQIIEYPVNNKALIKDLEKSSAPIGNQTGSTQGASGSQIASDVGNSKNWATPSNGVTPPSKGTSKSTIMIPIPQSVQNSLTMNWEMADFAGGKAALGLLKGVEGSIGHAMSGGESLFQALGPTAAAFETATLAASTSALSGLLQRAVNVIANPKKQAFFNGVEPRHFQFDWVFTPTTVQEATTIQTIISTMTKYALPELAADSLLFNFPMEFWMTFHGTTGFPTIDPMVCVGLTTNYTPNMLQLLTSGHAVQIIVSAAFLETTIKTQQRPGI